MDAGVCDPLGSLRTLSGTLHVQMQEHAQNAIEIHRFSGGDITPDKWAQGIAELLRLGLAEGSGSLPVGPSIFPYFHISACHPDLPLAARS